MNNDEAFRRLAEAERVIAQLARVNASLVAEVQTLMFLLQQMASR